jgi:hypothetical protein
MTTKLEKSLRREIVIDREPWVITITPTHLKLTRKGRRKGIELEWKPLISGDAALAAALNAAVRAPARRSAETRSAATPTRRPARARPRLKRSDA